MNKTNDLASRTLTLKRTFSAPVKLVWEAWTRPEHIANWWGPKGMKTRVIRHDFQVGGEWEYVMTMPDGSDFTSEGVYSAIAELEKIFTSANFKPMTEGVEMQIFFEDLGDKTGFTFHVIHPTEEYRKQQEEMGFYNGWGSVFERLEGYLLENNP